MTGKGREREKHVIRKLENGRERETIGDIEREKGREREGDQ